MTDTITNSKYWMVIKVVLIILLALFINYIPVLFLASDTYINSEVHSTLEAIGVMSALFFGLIKWQKSLLEKKYNLLWFALAFISLAIFDFFHSLVKPGHTFVFLHSCSVLIGGLLSALVWFPFFNKLKLRNTFIVILLVIISTISTLIIFVPGITPVMLNESDFDISAKFLNLLGGILFLVASGYFFTQYFKESDSKFLIYGSLTTLLGVGGINFLYDVLWTYNWWYWHLLRFTAFALALVFVIIDYRKLSKENNRNRKKYKDIFETSAVSVWEKDLSSIKAKIDDIEGDENDKVAYINNHPEFVKSFVDKLAVVMVNHQSVKMFGATNKEELIQTLHQVFLPETINTFKNELIAIAKGEKTFESESKVQTLKGKPFYILMSINFPEEKAMFSNVTVTIIDISKVKKAEQKLNEQTSQLLHLEKTNAIGVMAAGIAHELNNPLTGVLNYTQYCKKHVPKENKVYPILDDIIEETNRCVNMVKNLLSFTHRGDAGKSSKTYSTNIEDIVKKVKNLLSFRIDKGYVDFSIVKNGDIPNVNYNPDLMKQVFFNVLVNALDAVEGNCDANIKVGITPAGPQLKVDITDNGIGINEVDKSKVFEAFYTTKPEGKGTGLGLSICKNILGQYGGTIEFTTEESQGSTFSIYFPIK